MKAQLSKIAGRAAGLAAAAQTFVLANVVHAQPVDDFFGGSDFGSSAGLGEGNLVDTIAQIIRVALGFLGVIAVVIVLYGGFLWMTSAGNDDKVKQAKKVMISGVIGLVIILASFALASFVINSISGAVQGA